MSKIYVFANGEQYISIGGTCYVKTGGTGAATHDSSVVTAHETIKDCTGTSTNRQPVAAPQGTVVVASTFDNVSISDITSAQSDAMIEAQEESIQENLSDVNSDNFTLSSRVQAGSVRVVTTISPVREAFDEVKRIVHEATTKGVDDVTGFLFNMSQRLTLKLRLVQASQSLITRLVEDIEFPDISDQEPPPLPPTPPPPQPGEKVANETDHQSWFAKGPSKFANLNIPLSAEPRVFSKYLKHDDECMRLTDQLPFDSSYSIHEGDLYGSDACEFTWPVLDATNNGANWELNTPYGASAGWYVAEWYSSIQMSKGSGINRQVCVPRDRVIGIRYQSDHTLRVMSLGIDPTGFIANGYTARKFVDEVNDGTIQATLVEVPLLSYPEKEETNAIGQKVTNKLIVFGGDYKLSNPYLTPGFYIYYSDSHPDMIGWLLSINNSEDCKATA